MLSLTLKLTPETTERVCVFLSVQTSRCPSYSVQSGDFDDLTREWEATTVTFRSRQSTVPPTVSTTWVRTVTRSSHLVLCTGPLESVLGEGPCSSFLPHLVDVSKFLPKTVLPVVLPIYDKLPPPSVIILLLFIHVIPSKGLYSFLFPRLLPPTTGSLFLETTPRFLSLSSGR